MNECPKLYYDETHDDGSRTKRYAWPLMDAPNFEWAEGWRRERSTRVWQAIQCWLMVAYIKHEERAIKRYPARRLVLR